MAAPTVKSTFLPVFLLQKSFLILILPLLTKSHFYFVQMDFVNNGSFNLLPETYRFNENEAKHSRGTQKV